MQRIQTRESFEDCNPCNLDVSIEYRNDVIDVIKPTINEPANNVMLFQSW
jgi:hypothetical protein